MLAPSMHSPAHPLVRALMLTPLCPLMLMLTPLLTPSCPLVLMLTPHAHPLVRASQASASRTACRVQPMCGPARHASEGLMCPDKQRGPPCARTSSEGLMCPDKQPLLSARTSADDEGDGCGQCVVCQRWWWVDGQQDQGCADHDLRHQGVGWGRRARSGVSGQGASDRVTSIPTRRYALCGPGRLLRGLGGHPHVEMEGLSHRPLLAHRDRGTQAAGSAAVLRCWSRCGTALLVHVAHCISACAYCLLKA
jgi:hypothetical protein